jgi:hypothetical protein
VADVSALVGCEVRRLQLDYQVTLLLVDGPRSAERVSATLILEAPIRLEVGGQVSTVESNRKETHPPLCALVHTTVTEADASRDLPTLRLDDGSYLTRPATPL